MSWSFCPNHIMQGLRAPSGVLNSSNSKAMDTSIFRYFLRNLPCDPAIPLLGIYPKKPKTLT